MILKVWISIWKVKGKFRIFKRVQAIQVTEWKKMDDKERYDEKIFFKFLAFLFYAVLIYLINILLHKIKNILLNENIYFSPKE